MSCRAWEVAYTPRKGPPPPQLPCGQPLPAQLRRHEPPPLPAVTQQGRGRGRTTPHRQPHQRLPDPQGIEARFNTVQGVWGAGFTTSARGFLRGRANAGFRHMRAHTAPAGHRRRPPATRANQTHLCGTKGCLRLPHTPASRFLMAQPHAEPHKQQQAARTPTQGSCTAQTTAHTRVLHYN